MGQMTFLSVDVQIFSPLFSHLYTNLCNEFETNYLHEQSDRNTNSRFFQSQTNNPSSNDLISVHEKANKK